MTDWVAMAFDPSEVAVTVEAEVAATFMDRPHVALLSAGALRSGEAFWHHYFDAKFVTDNRVPREARAQMKLVRWLDPLRPTEDAGRA